MTDYQPYLDLIEQHYALHCLQCKLLQTKGQRIVLRLTTSIGVVVAKINTDPAAAAERIERDLYFLNFVMPFGLNCPPLIKTETGQSHLKTTDYILYLIGFLAGRHPSPSPHYFQQAGRLLGQLHQIPTHDFAYRTDFSMAAELPYIRQVMDQVEHWPDDRLAGQLQTMLSRLDQYQPNRQTLIHTDFFSKNLILQPDGELYLIDLDDAGVGDPLLAIGYFIGHELIHEVDGQMACTQADLEQFFSAYLQHHPLLPAELDWLPDCIYFGIMLYMGNPVQKSVAISDVASFRWLLEHEDWLRQQLAAYQSN
jgi:Ser/Thr protein kinase RdoA (MazF antagonist)